MLQLTRGIPNITFWDDVPLPPCICHYGLWYIPGAPGPYRLVDVPGVGQRAHTLAFKISPFCVHHGQGVWFGEAFGEDESS